MSGKLKKYFFGAMATNDLNADGKTIRIEPSRNGRGGLSGHIEDRSEFSEAARMSKDRINVGGIDYSEFGDEYGQR